jgi:MSHA pilin protein MshC
MSSDARMPTPPSTPTARARQQGFTLVELVMVLVILGVLAVFAVPRMLGSSDTAARGLHDSTLSYLRFAHKTAIAQRRTVCVAYTNTTIDLRIANTAGSYNCAGANGVVLNGADGKALVSVSGASYSAATVNGIGCLASPAPFSFDGLGQPVNGSGVPLGAAQCMQVGNASNSITVEAATGYVHE